MKDYDWLLFTYKNYPCIDCWGAWGVAVELEWSSVFKGIYFKIGCVCFHLGFWKTYRMDHIRRKNNG